MRRKIIFSSIIVMVSVISGCSDSVEKEYIYTESDDTIESVLEEENYARHILGQSLVTDKGLKCKISKSGLSQTFTFKDQDFNLTNRPMSSDNILLPLSLRSNFKNVSHTLNCKGFLVVVTPNYYVFTLGADDKAFLKVDGKTLVNFTQDSSFRSSSNSLFLKMGVYPIELNYSQNGSGNQGLVVSITNLSYTNFYSN